MAILKGDVKLVKSESMDDVPEGGGGPTANPVTDGVSNAIFPDISEVDRAAGKVQARKLHVWVQSNDTDTYLDPNVIVAEPPNDPNVSITLFTTNEVFDRRSDAISRIEAYLSVGPNYAGYLYGNHITGQKTLTIVQRTAELPVIGGTLCLTKREGFSNQALQYVRVTEAVVVLRTFTDLGGDYQRYVLTLKLSDALRYDFPGFDVVRVDPTKTELANLTKISDVIVADAARYYGVVPLQVQGEINDFSVKGTSIFTQLVPSAQISVPIADARTNQVLVGVVSGGGPITRVFTMNFTTTQSLFVGGAIKPGTLSIVAGSVTVTDLGGRLMSSGSEVGAIDYENGVASLLSNVFGAGGNTFTITYQPAGVPNAVSQSQSVPVTIEGRSDSYVSTIEPPPVAGTLSVSYQVNQRWYVLRDDGSGSIRGADSGYGSGTLNPSSGTVSVTLGALPDVGSEIIYQWVEPEIAKTASALVLDNDGKLYWPFNTSGNSSLDPGAKAITPGQLSVVWNDGVSRSAVDNGQGQFTGDATGTINYAKGNFRLSPTILPPSGTTLTVNFDANVRIPISTTLAAGNGNFGITNIRPKSIRFAITGVLKGSYKGNPQIDLDESKSYPVQDDGAGNLVLDMSLGSGIAGGEVTIGTVNYVTGAFTITQVTSVPADRAFRQINFNNNFYTMTDRVQPTLVQNVS